MLEGANTVQWDAELSLPCPVRVPLERAWQELREQDLLPDVRLLLEGHANKGEKAERNLGLATPTDIPWVFMTPGVGWLYGKESRERLMDSGAFRDTSGWPWGEGHLASLRDPAGHVSVVAANLTVLVVDDTIAHDRRRMESWEDLLDPSWERGVAFRGNGRTFCETTLLTLESRFGEDRMPGFRRSVGGSGHPAQMVKALSRPGADTLPAATLPLFFARLLPRREGLRVVWPREGAIASPVTLFHRIGASAEVNALARWLHGPEVAGIFSSVGLPSCRPGSDWTVPEGRDLLWIGWDAIRGGDLGPRLERLQELFDGAGT